MDKSSSLGYFPAIIEKAYEFKNSGQLRLAEEYFLKAEKISGKSFRGQIESTQQLRYLRLIVFTITFVVLLIIFLQLVRKRKWKKLWHRVLILTPYFTISLFFAWFIFGSPDGRAMSPILHKFVHFVDIRLLFFASPLVVAISYYYLISKRIISKQLAILNITILILVYIGVVLLGYALAPLASQGAGK